MSWNYRYLKSPSASTHSSPVTKWSEYVRMNILTLSISYPPLWHVNLWIRKYLRISEVNTRVQIQVSSRGNMVTWQLKVFFTISRHFSSIRPESEGFLDKCLEILHLRQCVGVYGCVLRWKVLLDFFINSLLHLGPGCQTVKIEEKSWSCGGQSIREQRQTYDSDILQGQRGSWEEIGEEVELIICHWTILNSFIESENSFITEIDCFGVERIFCLHQLIPFWCGDEFVNRNW